MYAKIPVTFLFDIDELDLFLRLNGGGYKTNPEQAAELLEALRPMLKRIEEAVDLVIGEMADDCMMP